jgi:hypothetical protein
MNARISLLSLAIVIPNISHGGAGKDGFRFLLFPPGARQAALGGAATGTDDVDSAAGNPALASRARVDELSAGWTAMPGVMSQSRLAILHPLKSGIVHGRVHLISYEDIPRYDGMGQKTGTFGAQDAAFTLGIGRPLGRAGCWGLNVKSAQETIAGHSSRTTLFDAGWAGRFWSNRAVLSASLENIGPGAPRILVAGTAVRSFSGRSVTGAEAFRSSDGTGVRLGQEYWVADTLALRAGYRSDEDASKGLSFGLGFRLGPFRVDYAFSDSGNPFGASHQVGLVWRFGGATERAYREGVAMTQRGEYAEAILKLKEVLDADPNHLDALRALREAADGLAKERSSR